MIDSRRSVADLAAARDGVITQGQLVAAGYHHTYAHDEAKAGRWQRLAHGIYLPTSEAATLRQRCHAALLHAGSRGVITASAGLALRGIPTGTTGQDVVVLVPAGTNRVNSGFVRLVRARVIPDHQVLQREGQQDLAVALPARCVADAIRRTSGLQDARAVGAAAVRDDRVDWQTVASLARLPGPGAGHFAQVAREILDGVRSPAEADLHVSLFKAASRGVLPPYLLNPDVLVDGVLLGSPDAWFPGLGLGDEVDSRQWHEEEGQLDRTLLRHEVFARHRLELAHITPSRFRSDPAAHVARLRQLVAARRTLSVPEPPGLVVLGRGPLLPARTDWPQVDASRWR
jgi:hypothetical protein